MKCPDCEETLGRDEENKKLKKDIEEIKKDFDEISNEVIGVAYYRAKKLRQKWGIDKTHNGGSDVH